LWLLPNDGGVLSPRNGGIAGPTRVTLTDTSTPQSWAPTDRSSLDRKRIGLRVTGGGVCERIPRSSPESVLRGRSEMIVGVIIPRPAQVQLRRATVQDVPALVHLRSLMFSSMGSDVGGHDAEWRVAAAGWFRDQLARPRQFAGFVIEHPVDGVVSAALGSCDTRAPGPHDVSGTQGHVFNICTESAHRRCGYGRACLTELLTWFHTDTDVRVVHLNATPEGAGMYQSAGFREPTFLSMRLQLGRPAKS
jgi:ribosomal protein S18 acetylase RimI-like enzyme